MDARTSGRVRAVKGKWGEQGYTNVRLETVDEESFGEALTLAWRNARTKASKGAKGAKGARVGR